MAKETRKPQKAKISKPLPVEVDQRMHLLGSRSTGKPEAKLLDVTSDEISRVMSALGKRGGKIGGKRRMETLTQKQRSDIAFKAARARWNKEKKG
jgi:hypothetical protein